MLEKLKRIDEILDEILDIQTEVQERKLLDEYVRLFGEAVDYVKKNGEKRIAVPENLKYLGDYFYSELPHKLEMKHIQKGIDNLNRYK